MYSKLSIKDILKNNTSQRPWTAYQEWNDCIFIHWKVGKAQLQKVLPKGFTPHLFKGEAWVSAVIFTMENLRLKNLPPFPFLSRFSEINLRTYVTAGRQSGVHFLSLEADERISSLILRISTKLPYRFSKIKRADTSFQSINPQTRESFKFTFKKSAKKIKKNSLDSWLTERYQLIQNYQNKTFTNKIAHAPWNLYKIQISDLIFDNPALRRLCGERADVCHYSPGTQVLAWSREKLFSA